MMGSKQVLNRPSRANAEERNKPYAIIPAGTIAVTAKGTQLKDFRDSPELF